MVLARRQRLQPVEPLAWPAGSATPRKAQSARRSLAGAPSTSTLQPALIGLFFSYWRTPEKDRSAATIKGFEQKTAAALALIDPILASRPYLAGPDFTLADILNGVLLYRYYTMGTEVAHFPHVEAWYARLKARPAYAEHVMVSYEELRGRLTF